MNREIDLYTNTAILIDFVKGITTEEMNFFIAEELKRDEILRNIVDGIKLDLKSDHQISLEEFLIESETLFERKFFIDDKLMKIELKSKQETSSIKSLIKNELDKAKGGISSFFLDKQSLIRLAGGKKQNKNNDSINID